MREKNKIKIYFGLRFGSWLFGWYPCRRPAWAVLLSKEKMAANNGLKYVVTAYQIVLYQTTNSKIGWCCAVQATGLWHAGLLRMQLARRCQFGWFLVLPIFVQPHRLKDVPSSCLGNRRLRTERAIMKMKTMPGRRIPIAHALIQAAKQRPDKAVRHKIVAQAFWKMSLAYNYNESNLKCFWRLGTGHENRNL